MSESRLYSFAPDYAVHPGEVLGETLQARNMKKVELALRTKLSTKAISQILNCKANISPDTAIRLERALGVSANIWNNLDANYRLHTAKKDDRLALEKKRSWAKKFPLAELKKRGIIPKSDNLTQAVKDLLDLFRVGSVEAWENQYSQMTVAYRKSPAFTSSKESLAVWLRLGELIAEEIQTEPFDKEKFISALHKIRKLTAEEPEVFQPQIEELCRLSGVAVVFIEELPKTHLSGATRWLNQDKALIMLSLRHKSDDHLWFTFLHEACHILRHGKKSVFIDEEKMSTNTEEDEANKFAADLLIPPDKYADFESRLIFTGASIQRFASSIGIAPGIVVGRLQHDKHRGFNQLNNLKRRFVLVPKSERQECPGPTDKRK